MLPDGFGNGWQNLTWINQLLSAILGGYVTLALVEKMGLQLKAIGLFHSSAFADDKEKVATRNRILTFVEKYGGKKFAESFIPPLFRKFQGKSSSSNCFYLPTTLEE